MAARGLDRGDWTRWLKKVYDLWGTDKEVAASRGELSEQLEVPVRSLQALLAVMRHVGIAEQRYQRHPSGKGRASLYRLVVPYEKAVSRLDTFGWGNISGFRSSEERPVEAAATVVTPAAEELENPFAVLRPLRYNESHAQVEAARQYRDRMAFIEAETQKFIDRGIKVGKGAFELVHDPVLDNLLLAMPYIESLETQVKNLSSRVGKGVAPDEMRRDNDLLRQEVSRLTKRVMDLTSSNALLRQELANRPKLEV